MQTIETLMHLMPIEALRAMVATRIKEPLKPEYFTFSRPTSVLGLLTRVRCTFDRTLAPVSLWHYEGWFDFDYYRMPLVTFSSPPITVRGSAPFNSRDLFKIAMDKYGIPTDRADVVDEVMPGYGTKLLQSGPNSYRFVGAVSIQTTEYLKNLHEYVINRDVAILNLMQITSDQIGFELVERVNTENHLTLLTPLVLEDVTFSIPDWVGPFALSGNTRITVSTQGPTYQGEVEITYSRQSFEETWAIPLVIPDGIYPSTAMLAVFIEEKTGYKVRPDDIIDEETTLSGIYGLFMVRFKPDCMGFIGEVLLVTESWTGWPPIFPPGSERYWYGNWKGDWIDQWD